jgi:O-acetyl-ADP-ribose deacetylase (regulator of RNase III)
VASVEVRDADVTTLAVDAIANAANTHLVLGAGVAGAIRRAGGPSIQEACDARSPIALGEAVETAAGALPCRHVIHAAVMGPDGRTSGPVIAAATQATLERAEELGCRSLALVAFGTGVGGFPLADAAKIMMLEVDAFLDEGPRRLDRIVFAVHGEEAHAAFAEAAADAGL